MPYIEERVESLEETAERLLKLSEQILQSIKESEKIREREKKEWDERFEKERQERERQYKEWLERFERERQEREKQHQEWLERFERERQEKERQHQEWLERFEREKQEREEQRKKDWEEWNKKLEEERKQWDKKFEQQRREDRKKWEEMVLRLRTLVEDIVAPNIETIAKKYFGCVDVEFDGLRIKKRHSTEKGKIKEFDFILICENIILVNETKANPKPEYAKEFVEFIKSGEFWEYFPEYKNKRLVPIFSTLYMPENIVKYLTDNGIYAMAMKGDEMDILNFNEILGRQL